MSLPRFAEEARARVARGYYAASGAGPAPRSFASAVGRGRRVVAEIKPASPSEGMLRDPATIRTGDLARLFAGAGAAALSVLTVPEGFGGSLDALAEASRAAPVPVLMKDFLVDPRQLVAARARGASAVLLIPECLRGWSVADAIEEAHGHGLEVVLETYDATGLLLGKRTDADVLAVNNRDLRDPALPVDPGRFARAIEGFGKDRPLLSLSGCRTRSDVVAQLDAGADAVLVGSALMRAPDPVAALKGVLP